MDDDSLLPFTNDYVNVETSISGVGLGGDKRPRPGPLATNLETRSGATSTSRSAGISSLVLKQSLDEQPLTLAPVSLQRAIAAPCRVFRNGWDFAISTMSVEKR